MDLHQSDSLVYDHDDLDDEQVVQPKIKRKRSIRLRPRYSMERTEDKSSSHRAPFHHGSWPLLQAKHEKLAEFNAEEFEAFGEAGSGSQDRSSPPLKQRCTLPSRVISPPVVQKSGRMSASVEDGYDHSIESWSSKAISSSGPSFVATRMTDSTQRKVWIHYILPLLFFYVSTVSLCQPFILLLAWSIYFLHNGSFQESFIKQYGVIPHSMFY